MKSTSRHGDRYALGKHPIALLINGDGFRSPISEAQLKGTRRSWGLPDLSRTLARARQSPWTRTNEHSKPRWEGAMANSESLRPLRPSIEGSWRMLEGEETASRRKNVRIACTTCKRRKLRCSGNVPCENCLKTGATCAIDEDGDQRRKHVLKRKLNSLEEKGQLLDRLIVALQEIDKISAVQVMNLIRSHASLDEIRAFIDDITDRPKLEKTPELIDACSSVRDLHDSHKRAMLARPDAKSLSDMVIFRVPAHPWTSVTDDDEFVSHLISLWFTWSHPFLNWIDRDLFIRCMQAQDTESEFCSPFLVNIILADACAYSDYPEAYAIGAEQWSRGLHFYKEAKRLLDQEEGKVTAAYVQGMGVLYVWPPPPNATKNSLRDAKSMDTTLWGLFNLASMTALSYQKSALTEIPQLPRPIPDHDVHRDKWSNYPTQSEKVNSHSQCLFRALCEVSLITYDLSWSLFGNKKEERNLDPKFVQATEEAYARLQKWYAELPDCLGISNAPPHVLSLHAKYHTIVQTIFGFLKDRLADGESVEKSDWRDKARERAQRLCLESARANARLIDLHRDLWGLDRMPPVNIHWVTVSLFTLLEHLDEKENREAFVILSITAKSFSHRWSLGKAMLRLFQVTSKQMGVVLPAETEALYFEFETKIWSPEDRKVLSSQYPNFAHSMKRGVVDEIEMDAFLAKFDDLHLAEPGDSTGGSVHSSNGLSQSEVSSGPEGDDSDGVEEGEEGESEREEDEIRADV
ncbi:uncharacterized protein N7459_006954 [Penicillium hispanicum]|uniref:uncharacterized protein n=1 Tax=Penicillium hispanicum TaxID=1080232 RepID=UPI0025411B59|nr:uncharacterized protein N7459_006954 [Penicillium hispanicum]KAJ5577990.1 hypothetical protein N7459_006954 [Penicillium hispanicum]